MPLPPPTEAEIQACRDALAAAGGVKAKAARALGIPVTTLKDRLSRAVAEKPAASRDPEMAKAKRDRLGKIADLLDRSGIDLDEVARVEKVRINEWEGLTKDADGNATVTPLSATSLVLTPKWADGPEWPVLQRAPVVQAAPLIRPEREGRGGWRTCVVVPDVQIGYYRRGDQLIPTHDESALSILLQVVEDADPDLIVMVGDNIDLPEFSRYRLHPAFVQTTQPSIDRAGLLAAQLRARVRPECRIIWIAGNHEERMPNYAIDNARAAFGLKRANLPNSWPVLSVPELCRFDESGVEFLPGYPANVFWINENLSVIHGNKVRSGGSTAHAYLPEIRHSVVYGHVHREEFAAVTRMTVRGPRTYEAMCFGCLCRIDGSVPGSASGYDLHGQPLATTENWQQGLGVIEYQEADGDYWKESIRIWNGKARWRGRAYSAQEHAA